MLRAGRRALAVRATAGPFSDDADGTMLGEGIGLLALKRLADAERDGDPIYAVIRGLGSSSDGRAKSIYAPLPAGQALALRAPTNAPATGPRPWSSSRRTAPRRARAIWPSSRRCASCSPERRAQRCALGSVKSQIGHTKAAAGAAGLIKAVLALHHKVLPATIKVGAAHRHARLREQPLLPQHRDAALDAGA